MEKLNVKSEEFLAYDPWGTPRILSRSGTFVNQPEEKGTSNVSVQAASQSSQPPRPIGNSRYFGGFEQYRQRLLPKSA